MKEEVKKREEAEKKGEKGQKKELTDAEVAEKLKRLKQLQQDCSVHQVPYPISAPHINVKRLMAERQGLSKKPGLGEAVRMAKMEFVGSHHRGIDDARNIARLLPYIFGTAKLRP